MLKMNFKIIWNLMGISTNYKNEFEKICYIMIFINSYISIFFSSLKNFSIRHIILINRIKHRFHIRNELSFSQRFVLDFIKLIFKTFLFEFLPSITTISSDISIIILLTRKILDQIACIETIHYWHFNIHQDILNFIFRLVILSIIVLLEIVNSLFTIICYENVDIIFLFRISGHVILNNQ